MTPTPPTSLIDTNIILRFILEDIPEQSPRARLLMRDIALDHRRTYLADTVVFETVFTLEKSYGFSRPVIRIALLGLLDLAGIVVSDRTLLEEAFQRWVEERSLSYADSYHLSLAKHLGLAEIISFDRKLGKEPAVRRIEP
jgi:predicted nucleic-acid-binding protein